MHEADCFKVSSGAREPLKTGKELGQRPDVLPG